MYNTLKTVSMLPDDVQKLNLSQFSKVFRDVKDLIIFQNYTLVKHIFEVPEKMHPSLHAKRFLFIGLDSGQKV